jgi:hypothetical protein
LIEDAEVGLTMFFTASEQGELLELLSEEGYPRSAEGVKQFLLDEARGDDSPAQKKRPSDSTAESVKKIFTNPDMIGLAQDYAPLARTVLEAGIARWFRKKPQ